MPGSFEDFCHPSSPRDRQRGRRHEGGEIVKTLPGRMDYSMNASDSHTSCASLLTRKRKIDVGGKQESVVPETCFSCVSHERQQGERWGLSISGFRAIPVKQMKVPDKLLHRGNV